MTLRSLISWINSSEESVCKNAPLGQDFLTEAQSPTLLQGICKGGHSQTDGVASCMQVQDGMQGFQSKLEFIASRGDHTEHFTLQRLGKTRQAWARVNNAQIVNGVVLHHDSLH